MGDDGAECDGVLFFTDGGQVDGDTVQKICTDIGSEEGCGVENTPLTWCAKHTVFPIIQVRKNGSENKDRDLLTDGGQSTDAVVQGDAFDALADLEEDFGHAAIVDYPWKFEAQNGTGRFGNDGDRGFDAYETEDHERLADVLAELADSLVDGAWLFVFADDETSPEFRRIVEDSPFTYRRTLVWDREKFGMGTYHRVQHYPIISATNGETERYVRDRGTVFRALKHDWSASTNDYPTGKPVKLYRELLRAPVLEEGERLLEPFCGSGPGAAIAAERDLDYWGVDVNPDAVDQTRECLEQQRIGQVTL